MSFGGGQTKSIGAIRTALAKIISLNNDFSAVLREHEDTHPLTKNKAVNASVEDRKRKQEDWNAPENSKKKAVTILEQTCIQPHKAEAEDAGCNKTIWNVSSITGKAILEELEKNAMSLNVDISVAAKSLVIAQVKLMAGLARDGENFDRDLEGIISTTRLLVSRKILNTADMGEHLLKESSFLSLPLTSLWRFSSTGVVSLEEIVKSIHDKGSCESSILEDLTHLVLHGKNEEPGISVVSDALAVLLGIAYDLDTTQYDSLCKYASTMLHSLTERMLENILEGGTNEERVGQQRGSRSFDDIQDGKESSAEDLVDQESMINIYHLMRDNLKVTPEAIESYCSAQLLQVLTHRPNLQLGRVLKEQERWRSTQANSVLSSFLHSLIVVLGHKATLDTLELVVMNDEVNWGCVLTLVATALNCHRDTVGILKGMIEKNIRKGCEEQEMELLVIGLLFARHASQEGRHIFPLYSQWFSSLFAAESTSPVTDKQSFVFFIRFLTDLVPHEPAYCLRAHLTNQMYTPRGCQEILRDYCHLARARLKDLKETLDPNTAIHQSEKEKSKVADEVETAVTHYAQTSKVPNFVLEASIFRKPYFRSAFLPTLLTPRPMPDVPDARAKLIETLHLSGKIPSNMYKNYIELCQKECTELLTGVFLDVEEDVIIEEPITELSNILEELVPSSGSSSDNTTADASAILPVLSRIAQKLEDMMKLYDTRQRDVKHLTLDVKAFNPKMIAYQVIEKFTGIVEKICLTAEEGKITKKNRPFWLSQYLSLLSGSVTLQSALFIYLLHVLSPRQQEELSQTKIHNLGIILSELCNIDGLFLPVVGALSPECKPASFLGFFLEHMSFDTYQSCVLACWIMSCWLDWSGYVEDGTDSAKGSLTSLPPMVMQLYDCLAPRVTLMKVAQEGKEVTMAHVYTYLEGLEVSACAAFYYRSLRGNLCEKKVPLEKWISFELSAAWGEVPLDVRLTYLQLRVLRDFVTSDASEMCGKVSLGDAIVKMVFVLMEIGLKKRNAGDMLLLLQSLSQQRKDIRICLLEEWHFHYPEYRAFDSQILSFMSICRSLSPCLFLRPTKLLQHAEHLKTMVEHLTIAGQDLQMNLCDTSFLLTALFHAASDHGVKNIQVQQSLAPLRMAVLYHFESLKSIFTCHTEVIGKHSCLQEFWSFLKCTDVTDTNEVTPQEAGIRCLALRLKSTSSNLSMISPKTRICYFRWLLAYIGQQQIHGRLPFFPDPESTLYKISGEDKEIILTCCAELELLLKTFETSKLTQATFPDVEERLLPLQTVPTACVLLILYTHELAEGKLGNGEDKKRLDLKYIDLLIQCHHAMSKACELKKEGGAGEVGSRNKIWSRKSYSLSKNEDDTDLEELEYLAELNHKLFTFVSNAPSEILSKLPKNTLLKCDPDLRAAISYKLKSK
ncbi:uncharacterized protein LOC125036506 [Penaeus chinensis]|uniref:uncharacterized protein LOC125036506 n=1 Tax=Penaeus chinensis TaxID=139456 RepID=UPI001FB6C888|nr:uncharacterized protein LOC125036506 [Penaeus chinensis]XP_047485101.1 uncharacterized protein LOC125036506 [Penaeus chinensis]